LVVLPLLQDVSVLPEEAAGASGVGHAAPAGEAEGVSVFAAVGGGGEFDGRHLVIQDLGRGEDADDFDRVGVDARVGRQDEEFFLFPFAEQALDGFVVVSVNPRGEGDSAAVQGVGVALKLLQGLRRAGGVIAGAVADAVILQDAGDDLSARDPLLALDPRREVGRLLDLQSLKADVRDRDRPAGEHEDERQDEHELGHGLTRREAAGNGETVKRRDGEKSATGVTPFHRFSDSPFHSVHQFASFTQ